MLSFSPSLELLELGLEEMEFLDSVLCEWSDAMLEELGLRSCLLVSEEFLEDKAVFLLGLPGQYQDNMANCLRIFTRIILSITY